MSTRSLRACLVCAYIQPSSKFSQQGCPNCEDFLQLSGSPEAVGDCTSAVFEGTITLNSSLTAAVHGESWVAKWLRLEGYAAGLYAVKVSGIVSTYRVRTLLSVANSVSIVTC